MSELMVQNYNPKRGRRRSGTLSRNLRRSKREMQVIPTTRIPSEDVKDVIISDSSNTPTKTHIEADSMTSCSTLTKAKQNLSTNKVSSVDIAPEDPKNIPKLSIETQSSLSIPPATIHHPAIINACFAILGKHPSQLSPAEVIQFQQYKQFKADIGDPIEENVVYMPIGGLRTCLQCNNLT